MSEDIVISVENVTKAYRIWDSPAARLLSPLQDVLAGLLPNQSASAQYLRRQAASRHKDFHALRNVSFAVRRGESVGVIGRNGSGKSTLLQVIAGTLQPTAGCAKVKGRVAALLELGSGFNPEFTGRENAYLNGAVLGLARRKVEQRFDAIAAFADIGDYIDQPVKTYSSGMLVRLAFAVATSSDPDILIVDEALSVGDVFFQQRCFTRIRELLTGGTTLFLVTHDMAAVQNLCDRAILLHEGGIDYLGPPEECASRYFARYSSSPKPVTDGGAQANIVGQLPWGTKSAALIGCSLLGRARARHGTKQMEIMAVAVKDTQGKVTLQASLMQSLRIEVLVRANIPVAKPSCGVHFFDRMNNLVYAAGNIQLGTAFVSLAAGGMALIAFTVSMCVQPGPYTFNIAVGEPVEEDINLGHFYDVCEGLGPIDVIPPQGGVWPFYGIANLPMKMEIFYE